MRPFLNIINDVTARKAQGEFPGTFGMFSRLLRGGIYTFSPFY